MLYRDSENGMVMGVCAGLAYSFDLNTTGIRIVTFICLLCFTMATLLLYFMAGFLLRNRPLHVDQRRERQFWHRSRNSDYYRSYRYTRRTSRRG